MPAREIVEFVRLLPQSRPPKRADRSAAGFLPSRAQRYCDALTTSTGYGYWVFPPMDVRLIWDGEQVAWSYGDDERWLPLSATDSGAVQFPGFAAAFDEAAPEELQGYSPPFLTALPETGAIQMWTGLLVRSRPGWSISVRPPVNLPPIPGLQSWEGIIETDIWFGPLFTNVRLTRTDTPVHIRAHTPFIQVQPLPQIAYRDETLSAFRCADADELDLEDWRKLGQVLNPDPAISERAGNYAVRVRKRRACPYDPALLSDPVGMPASSKPSR